MKKRKGPSGQRAHRGDNRKSCSVEGCGTLAQNKGLCCKHGGGTPKTKPCSVEGCGTLAASKGLCYKHGGGSNEGGPTRK